MKNKIRSVIFLSVIAAVILFIIFFLPRIIGDAVYPLKYRSTIKKYTQEYKVNPNLIAAIIKIESGFNPYATSPMGARGLMQVMPGTGAGIARQLNDRHFSYNKLYDPATSIRYGTYYIKQQLNKYKGSEALALTAYNGGASAADYYATYGVQTGLSTETRTYPGKVLRAKKAYDQIYGEWWKEKKEGKKEEVKPLVFLKNLLRPEPSLIDIVITWLMPK